MKDKIIQGAKSRLSKSAFFVKQKFYKNQKNLPGLAAMALLSLGAAFIYLPAGLLVGGALLLLVDHNM